MYLALITTTSGAPGTLVLSDHSNPDTPYMVTKGWVPQTTKRSTSLQAGRGMVEDVTETIPITISGDTPADIYTALNNLYVMLDLSIGHQRGENNPVILLYQPPDAGNAPGQALVLGPDGDGPMVSNPEDLHTANGGWVASAMLRFRRQGAFMSAITDESTTSSSRQLGNGAATATFGTTRLGYHPTTLKLTSTGFASGRTTLPPLTLFVGRSADDVVQVSTYNAFASGARWLYMPDNTGRPASGAYARFSGDSTTATSGIQAITPFYADETKRIAVYAVVRNLDAKPARVRCELLSGTNAANIYATDDIAVDAGTLPTVVSFGVVPITTNVTAMRMVAYGEGGSTLDVSNITLIDVSRPSSRVLTLDSVAITGTDTTITISHRLLSHDSPLAALTSGNAIGTHNDSVLWNTGGSIACAVLCPDGANWRLIDTGGNVISYTIQASRTRQFVTPQ